MAGASIIYLLPTTSLIDLTYLFDSSIVILSYGLTVRAVATSIGSVLSGLLYKFVDRRFGFIIGMLLIALLIVIVPFLDNWLLFMVIMAALGVTSSVVDVAENSLILDLWGEECNSYMQGLHFSYGLGIALAPICISPFLGLEPKVMMSGNLTESSATEATLSTIRVAKVTAKPLFTFQLVFILAGISAVSASLVACAMWFVESRKMRQISAKSSTEHVLSLEMDSAEVKKRPEEKVDHNPPNKRLALILGFVIVLFYVGMEVNSLNFVTEYIHFLGYDVQTAAQQATIMSSSYAFFRFTGIFVSRFVVTDKMVIGHMSMIVVSALMLLFLTGTSLTWITIGLFLLGSGCSVIFPCIYAMIEERIHLSNAAVGLLAGAGCIPGILYPLVMPSIMEDYPMAYVYNIIGSIVLVIGCIAILIKQIPKPVKTGNTHM